MLNNPFRVMIADSESPERRSVQVALEKSGFEVSVAGDEEDALRQFRAHPCDLVILDPEMAGTDGYRICSRLRVEAGGELPIVMATSTRSLDALQRAYEAGASDFIEKPVDCVLIGYRIKCLFRFYQTLLELRRDNARQIAILDAIPDLMLELDSAGRYLGYHVPHAESANAPVESFLGHTVSEVLPPDAAQTYMAALHEAIESGFSTGKQFELQMPDGQHWFELSVACKAVECGHNQHFIVLSRDITERKEAERKIARLAYYDSLTGLPNRVSFFERLEREVNRAKLLGVKLAVLFLDLDCFKNINDTMGHAAGDLVLQWMADNLRMGVRPTDMVSRLDSYENGIGLARLGGDEFTVIIPNLAHNDDALVVTNRIRELIARPLLLEGRQLVLTASIGIVVYPDNGDNADTLIKNADAAMYHAKQQGRNNCQFYATAMNRQPATEDDATLYQKTQASALSRT